MIYNEDNLKIHQEAMQKIIKTIKYIKKIIKNKGVKLMKKHIAIIVFLILSAIFVLLFGLNYSEIFGVFAVLVVYSAFVVRDVFKHCRKRWLKILGGIYQVLVVLFVISFIVFEGVLWYNMAHFKKLNEIPSEDYAIVLGAGLNGDKPGPVLKDRLNEAIKYLDVHKDTEVIVSGGQGSNEIVPEAVAMKNYLVQKGINSNRIIEENKSQTTMQNFEFSKEILEQKGVSKETVVVITSDFHLDRALILAKIYGVNAIGLSAKTPFVERWNFSIREYSSYIIDTLRLLKQGRL